ncbi:MAG: tetratricopeptide repeat protein [Carboxylicivirga sp.]|nr:tetratricopeptide repeat protein [Carboxylicivirga sp.]
MICRLTKEAPDFRDTCEYYLPVRNELEDVQKQLIRLKAKKNKRRTVGIVLVIFSVALITVLGTQAINAIFKNKRLSEGFERTGGEFFEEEDYKAAIYYYELSIEYDAQNYSAMHLLGRCYEELEVYSKAITYYSEAIRINPRYAKAFRSRGYLRYKLNKYDTAIKDYIRSLELDPQNTTALGNLAFLYVQVYEYEAARKYYYELLKYKPNDYKSIAELAKVEFDLNNIKVSEELAYKALNRLAENKDSPHRTLGLVYIEKSMPDSAIKHLSIALKYAPDNDHHYNNLGFALALSDNEQEAIINYNKAISLNANNPSYFLNRGDSHSRLGRYKEAISDYNKTIELAKLYEEYNCGVCYNNRAVAKYELGDTIGYNQDLELAKKEGFPETYSRWSILKEKNK